MIIFCNSGGEIVHVIADKIYQGSAGVNKIYFVGQFPSSSQVMVAYKLPNGITKPPKMLTHITKLDGIDVPDDELYNVWEAVIGAKPKVWDGKVVKDENGNIVYDLDYTITENYGTATIQFFVYGASVGSSSNGVGVNMQGGNLATGTVNFTIEKGVPSVLPISFDEEGDVKTVLAEILELLSSTQTQYGNVEKAIDDINDVQLVSLGGALSDVSDDVSENKSDIGSLKERTATVEGKVEEIDTGLSVVGTQAEYAYAAVENDLGSHLKLTVNNKTFEVEAQLIAKNGNILSTQTIDLPLESVVIGGYYDDEDKTVALKLQHGGVVTFPIGDLVDGLLSSSEKGQPNGVASLDENGKVPAEQLPEGIGGGLPEGFNPEDYVKLTDYATESKAGVVITNPAYGIQTDADGNLKISFARNADIDAKSSNRNPIVPANGDYFLRNSITTNTETLTDEEKASACDWIGALKVQNPEFDGGATRGYVYFIDTDGNQIVKKVQIQSNADTIPLRNPNGNFYVQTPTLDYECVNKRYAEDNFIAKLEPRTYSTLYVQNTDGTFTQRGVTGVNYNQPGFFVSTVAAGQTTNEPNSTVVASTPIGNWDCTPKKYVDDAMAILESTVSITIEGASTENYTANVPAYRKNDPFAYIGAVCDGDDNHVIIGYSAAYSKFILRDLETGETFKCESWNINE